MAGFALSLPETRFARIDDGAHQGSGVQQHLRTARSRVCRARPSRAKHEFSRHYNRRRISLEFVEAAHAQLTKTTLEPSHIVADDWANIGVECSRRGMQRRPICRGA